MRRSPGMFAGNPPPPQDPTHAIARGIHDSLTGDAGLRLADAHGLGEARNYTAGGFTPQRFLPGPLKPDAAPNSPAVLQVAPVAINTRRSLGRFRGFPPGTAPKGLG